MAKARTTLSGELVAEFAGTFVMMIFGIGVVAQVVASGLGAYDSIAWAWGIGLTFGILVAARTSGAHLNPAVSLAAACIAGFPWRKVLPYSIAQTLGAFVAALLIRWNYHDALTAADPGHTTATQVVFSTLPANGATTLPTGEPLRVGPWDAMLDQILATAIFVFLIFAVLALPARGLAKRLTPLLIGLVLVGIGFSFGANAGYAVNPARDLGPRLASFLTGYDGAWRDQFGELYYWVPIAGPLIGAVIGAALFQLGRRTLFPPAEQSDLDLTVPADTSVGVAKTVQPQR